MGVETTETQYTGHLWDAIRKSPINSLDDSHPELSSSIVTYIKEGWHLRSSGEFLQSYIEIFYDDPSVDLENKALPYCAEKCQGSSTRQKN